MHRLLFFHFVWLIYFFFLLQISFSIFRRTSIRSFFIKKPRYSSTLTSNQTKISYLASYLDFPTMKTSPTKHAQCLQDSLKQTCTRCLKMRSWELGRGTLALCVKIASTLRRVFPHDRDKGARCPVKKWCVMLVSRHTKVRIHVEMIVQTATCSFRWHPLHQRQY